ncbi:glycosyltransferase family 87 protein [Halobiforma nitratireducens]|uniref:DUF2029 domain-containing protein n=1 Tax=Halobiforma nitratireducens JCM 10879 TaxID=1227454 RepID=M0M903_9EURY|nr:glycosyltransferase family 87 protein [Halobiforma nitratireducens]EMA40885.1 hypothetical protein C446_06900 [Halobiforma nitratireducens JCM 10879]
MSRPIVSRPYLGAWLVLLWSAAVGYSSYVSFLGLSFNPLEWSPDDRLGVNYYVYHYSAEALLAGEDFYTATPPGFGDHFTYLYPPITILTWVPFTALDSFHGFLLLTAITIAVSAASAVAIVRYIERWDLTLGWLDVGAIFVFFLGVHSTGTLNFGNINLLLAAGIVFGFFALDRGREITAGVLFGAVALMKVFPALVGLYLLRVRSWAAIAGATATGLGGLAASALVFGPDTLYRFFFEILLPRSDTADFVGGYAPDDTYYVTIQRPLSHLIWNVYPDAPAAVLPVAAALVLGAVLAYCFLRLETRTDHLVAIHATLTATVIFMSSLRFYLALVFFSWVSLLYVWHDEPDDQRRGQGVVLGIGLLAVAYLWYGSLIWSYWPLVVAFFTAGIALLYVWFEDAVPTLFVVGGLVASITNRPSSMVAQVEGYPGPLPTILEPIVAVGTLQLYGLLLMLGACLLYKYRQGVGVADVRAAGRTIRHDLETGAKTVRARFE